MTGNDILISALQKINYTAPGGEVDMDYVGGIGKRGLDAINYILADIQHIIGEETAVLETINDTVPLSDDILIRVMPWGVAMMLAQSEGDADNQGYCAELYNRLRNSFKRNREHIVDKMPWPIY